VQADLFSQAAEDRMKRTLSAALWFACLLLASPIPLHAAEPEAAPSIETTPPPTAAQLELFERDVRPLLAERCFSCHGDEKQHGGLRLDSRDALLAGGDGGAIVDLARPTESRLLTAIGYEDTALQMPPPPAEKLSASSVAAIRNWIATGAPWTPIAPTENTTNEAWKTHWAFQPLRDSAVPSVKQVNWARSPIDTFLLSRMEAQGISPAAAAPRAALIRRATYDLLGLPPSEAEVADFVADSSPEAFTKVVDRLLASPHYGERWGRYWLDVARFADTKGYVRLQEQRRFYTAYTYRDYVVRALNEDLPYDRFITEQLAADLLPDAQAKPALAGLGFLTLGRRFTGNTHDVIDDRIDVTTRGLLGLTVTCARCHDHKYDPIPTADYYGLYGVFATSDDPAFPQLLGPAPTDAAAQAFQKELEARQQALDQYQPEQYALLVNEFRDRAADYLVAAIAGRQPPQQPLPKDPGEIRQIVVERWLDYLNDRSADDSVFSLWKSLAELKPENFADAAAEIIKEAPTSSDAQGTPSAPRNELVRRHFTEHPPTSMADVARGYGQLLTASHAHWQAQRSAALAAAAPAPTQLTDPADEALRQVLYGPDSPAIVGPELAVAEYLYDVKIQDEVVKRRNQIHEHLAQTATAPPRAHTLVESAVTRAPRILIRGNPTRPGRQVPRQFLSVLSSAERKPFTAATGRLELARAIASPENPLTARVIVNRVWAGHFGEGLVRTPSNFGLRGESPTHPELLDHLAIQFMKEGWSLKKLHRQLMLTSAYQQACDDRPDCIKIDPENRLLWKMNRRRLDVEALRDSMLTAAGSLDLALGGPSVDLAAAGMNRRTLYGVIDRQELPRMLTTFDFASPDAHSAARYMTTVPQQALYLMNSPWTIDIAKAFAARAVVQQAVQPAERIRRMIQLAWGRAPTEREQALALRFIQETPAAAAPLSAWEAFAQALLLANEFCYVD